MGGTTLPDLVLIQTIPAPILPSSLNNAIVAAQLRGEIATYVNSFGVAVPANSTVVEVYGTGGLPTTIHGKLSIDATTVALVDKGVELQIQVDGNDVIGPPSAPDYTIAGLRSTTLGQDFVTLNSLTVSITNNTSTDIVVFMDGEFIRMSSSFYTDVYLKALKLFGWNYIQNLLAGEN